jgi:TM2 domain-containing membrane protein YozV
VSARRNVDLGPGIAALPIPLYFQGRLLNQAPVKAVDEKFCSECGAIIKARAEICPKCGVRQLAPSGRNKLAAALFAIFLGTFGIHKFYLGRVGWGIVYLLFFWTGIPTIVGLIEGIVYLVMSERDFAAKYG